jgi:hypothetical protein
MGCWYEPDDDARFRDMSVFVLPAEREAYDAIHGPAYNAVDVGPSDSPIFVAVEDALQAKHGSHMELDDLSWNDQIKWVTEYALDKMRADQVAAAAVVADAEQIVASAPVELATL